jgi:thiol:disulfide interchange protein DsbA
MSRKRAMLLAAWLMLPAVAIAADSFESGKDYYEAAYTQGVETGAKIEVREFFWYGCPHCYDLEPYVETWLKKKPANAAFVRTPGMFDRWVVHARAFYALESINAVDKVHRAFFDAMHRDKRTLNDETSITNFVVGLGVNREQFRAAWNSFGVRTKLERARQLMQDLGIQGVPTFVVDGRYITSPSLMGIGAGDAQSRTLEVVDFLVAKSAKERKVSPKR